MGHEQDPILQEAYPLRKSLGDLEKDMDGLEDPEKDVGHPEDRTNHSQVSLKKRKDSLDVLLK